MESFLNRYRNITVLLLVVFGQLVLLAYQVRNDQSVPAVRFWTVTAVTPLARVLEGLRGGSIGFVRNYLLLHDVNADNRRLREENSRLKIENTFLKNDLNRADRAQALAQFQTQTPSRMIGATVIATGAGSNSKVVFVDRGSVSGVMRGMAVVTPDGVVGKVEVAYPTASEVLLITDPTFAAGVISQKNHVHGTLKGQGNPVCKLDYVPPEDKMEPGDVLYTSGDDRIFPRGFEVGVVKAVRPGSPFQEILVSPTGMQHGLEEVLILIQGVHQEIPDVPPPVQPVYIAPPAPGPATTPGAEVETAGTGPTGGTGTDADRLRTIYKSVGDAQNHKFGEGLPGSKPPDFTKLPSTPGGVAAATGAGGSTGTTGARVPGATGTTGVRVSTGSTGSPAVRPPGPGEPPPAKKQTTDSGTPRPEGTKSVPAGPPRSAPVQQTSPIGATPGRSPSDNAVRSPSTAPARPEAGTAARTPAENSVRLPAGAPARTPSDNSVRLPDAPAATTPPARTSPDNSVRPSTAPRKAPAEAPKQGTPPATGARPEAVRQTPPGGMQQ